MGITHHIHDRVTGLTIQQKLLLGFSIFLVPFSLAVFIYANRTYSPAQAYLYGMGVYWLCLFLFSGFLLAWRFRALKDLLVWPTIRKQHLLVLGLGLIPLVGLFFTEFWPNINALTQHLLLLLAVTALINGFLEEVYWRGLYLKFFGDQRKIRIIIATLFFTLVHIGIYQVQGLDFKGGWLPLIGGAAVLGLLWAWMVDRLKSILPTVLLHIGLNFFAFTGFYLSNGF